MTIHHLHDNAAAKAEVKADAKSAPVKEKAAVKKEDAKK